MKRYPKQGRQRWGHRKAKALPAYRRNVMGFWISGIGPDDTRQTEWIEPDPSGYTVSKLAYASDVRIAAVLEPVIPKRIPITVGYSGEAP